MIHDSLKNTPFKVMQFPIQGSRLAHLYGVSFSGANFGLHSTINYAYRSQKEIVIKHTCVSQLPYHCCYVLALDLEGVHDVKLHHPSSSVATSNQ